MCNANSARKHFCSEALTDGWTIVWAKEESTFVITTPQPVLYKNIETEENKHTAEYIIGIKSEVLEKTGLESFCILA